MRLLIELAGHDSETPVFLSEIAKLQDVSEKYLSKLVIPLRRAGMIKSVRGAHGGYCLARSPAEISLLQVIDCLEGGLQLVACVGNPKKCQKSDTCASRQAWSGLEAVMKAFCKDTSLATIVAGQGAADCFE